jgi:outer membrane protein assembly factor BamE (lipoprotein component of BamABCDE complex)
VREGEKIQRQVYNILAGKPHTKGPYGNSSSYYTEIDHLEMDSEDVNWFSMDSTKASVMRMPLSSTAQESKISTVQR